MYKNTFEFTKLQISTEQIVPTTLFQVVHTPQNLHDQKNCTEVATLAQEIHMDLDYQRRDEEKCEIF